MLYFKINLRAEGLALENIHGKIGNRVKDARKKRYMTQEELGEIAGITSNYISLIENGKKKASIETLQKISTALNIPLSRFFSAETTKTKGGEAGYDKKIYSAVRSLGKKEQNLIMDIITKMKKYRKK